MFDVLMLTEEDEDEERRIMLEVKRHPPIPIPTPQKCVHFRKGRVSLWNIGRIVLAQYIHQ
jgi:hypothetical protein